MRQQTKEYVKILHILASAYSLQTKSTHTLTGVLLLNVTNSALYTIASYSKCSVEFEVKARLFLFFFSSIGVLYLFDSMHFLCVCISFDFFRKAHTHSQPRVQTHARKK